MRKSLADNLKVMLILFFIVTFTRLIEGIPWWSFIIPVIILGMVIASKKWDTACFLTGFLSGFLIWVGSHIYYQTIYEGSILSKNGFVPLFVIVIISGLIGGTLTGLALYTGKSMSHRKIDTTL